MQGICWTSLPAQKLTLLNITRSIMPMAGRGEREPQTSKERRLKTSAGRDRAGQSQHQPENLVGERPSKRLGGQTTYLQGETLPLAAEDSRQVGEVLGARSCYWTLVNSLHANHSFTLSYALSTIYTRQCPTGESDNPPCPKDLHPRSGGDGALAMGLRKKYLTAASKIGFKHGQCPCVSLVDDTRGVR